MSERRIIPGPIFDKTFGRLGEVLKPAKNPRKIKDYPIFDLGNGNLPMADAVVRKVESDFAPDYDRLQFKTWGMIDMAETDSALLEKWVPDPNGMRFLDIGPGTGRSTLPFSEYGNRVYTVETARPYLDRLVDKAALAGVDPSRFRLGVGDIQSVSEEVLNDFLEGKSVDVVTFWFGSLALMTTDSQEALNKCARSLTLGGSLLITTNSLNGLSYRIPEEAVKKGADLELPLGYKPSIATRRSFQNPDSDKPDGMILANDLVLPARFYDPKELKAMLEKIGLRVVETVGITRLTGLFPANPENEEALAKYVEVISTVEPGAAEQMSRVSSIEAVWRIAKKFDVLYSKDAVRLPQYNYPAIRAIKVAK